MKNCLDGRRIVCRDESRFEVSPEDNRRRIWKYPRQWRDPGLSIKSQTSPQQGVVVMGVIFFDSRTHLVVISVTLTAQLYDDDNLQPVMLPFFVTLWT